MRNLKKILALVLALVMSFSLMATANAFTDDEQITDTYETAVTVLDGLKVFQGYDDGSFQPQSPIRRSEVAAIIYRIVTGDVTDAQVGIYADYNKFDDVKSTSWYAGYVNFCANAEYIKGRDARTFDPDSYVTGYEALAMILRAIGYDKNGEFTGSSWQVQTAATGELRGITKNITAGTLGTYASREVVAEILFQTILVDKVNYTPAFGYQLDDTSLGWDTFELESIEGVVVANEYADLYGTKPMKAGRTEMNVDGDSYVIDYATTLEDIGENHAAYITEGKNVLAIAKTGNTVFETGAETDISTDKKFENVTGLERGSAEEFINFDGGSEYKVSDWKLSYVLKFEAGNNDKLNAFLEDEGLDLTAADFDRSGNGNPNYTYTREVTFNAGKAIPSADIGAMKYIFNEADEDDNDDFILGEVYVGTQSNDDISDDPDMSWKTFQNKYIDTDENAIEVEENENGNWLKVVDVDGDGVADYVMKTIYTMAGIEDIDKEGTITLSCDERNLNDGDELNYVNEDIDVVAEDEVSENDVVYYAVIDGNAYTYLAEVATAEIDRVRRNELTAVTTDGDEYVQSGVHNHIIWDGYVDGVRNLEGDVNYDLYLDKYGYLAAFTESTNNAGFVLITDGYYQSGRSEDIYAAKVWDGEELVDTDITDGGDRFIGDANDDNGWGKLDWFYGINYFDADTDNIQTIVAALSEDGTLTPVDDLYRYREEVVMVGMGDSESDIPDRDRTMGTIYDTTRNSTAYDDPRDGQVDVRALSTTTYYYVYNTNNGTIVREYMGYADIPDLGNDAWKIENVYAVASRATDANEKDYYTAEIVVVELMDGYAELDAEEVFLVDLPEAMNSVGTELARVIRADGTEAEVRVDLDKSELWAEEYREYDPAWGKWVMPGLYFMWESADEDDVYVIEKMTPWEIANSRYLVGTVNKNTATGASNWTSVDAYELTIDPVDPWFNFSGVSEYAGYEDSAKNVDDSSSYYTLSYDIDDWNAWVDGSTSFGTEDYSADLSAEDRDDVLAQSVKGQDANYVLVRYNSDDEIVYAISYRFEDDNAVATEDDIFTWFIWTINTPAAYVEPVPGVTDVTFYGQPTKAGTDADFEATVSYADALAAGDNGILVENGTIVLGDETTALTAGKNVYEGTILGDDGEYYTFKLTQEAAGDDVGLYLSNGTTPVDQTATTSNDLNADGDPMSIANFVGQFRAKENATVTWTFGIRGGDPITVIADMNGDIIGGDDITGNETTSEVTSVEAIVTNEGETASKPYYDQAGIQAGETDAFETAVEEAVAAMRQNVLDAINEAAEADGLVFTEDVLNDTTTLSAPYGAYSLKTLLETRAANFADGDYGTTPEDVADAVETTVGDYDAIATAFLTAYKNDAQADADQALADLIAPLYHKDVTVSETVTDPADFESAILEAVKALVTDPKATVTMTYGDLGTTLSTGINGAGTITVTGAIITVNYKGASAPMSRTLGDITVYYNVNV